MKHKGLLIICIITTFFLLLDMSDLSAKDRTYSSRVIDADTKEPIEGAVVVTVWHEERATPTGPSSRFKDVKEILTDKDGAWSIVGPEGETNKLLPGLLQLLMIYITEEPTFIVFKPGYCSWPHGFSIEACKEKLKPSGRLKVIAGETIEIPKLTNREDRIKAQEIWPSLMDNEGDKETLKKIRNFIKLLNKEQRYLGFQETYKEIENEK